MCTSSSKQKALRFLLTDVVIVSMLDMSTSPNRTLYVRGVPDALLREAKALAARQGTTLTALVIAALERAVGVAPVGKATASLRGDIEWYEANKPRLLRRYRGEHVAVVDGKVVDHDRAFSALAGRVFERFGRRSVFMPRCAPEERTARIPGPRVSRR